MQRIVLATGNPGKVRELGKLLEELKVEILPQAEFAVPEIEETGLSFVENALLKARNAALHTGLPAIADDSGLEVDALQGAPGIYSSRYAGPEATDTDNIHKLLHTLRDIPEQQRTARFRCLLVYLRHVADPCPVICQGTWEGYILSEPRGENGFGYDPVFYIPSLECSSAQLEPEVKNRISHRGKALKQLKKELSRIGDLLG